MIQCFICWLHCR